MTPWQLAIQNITATPTPDCKIVVAHCAYEPCGGPIYASDRSTQRHCSVACSNKAKVARAKAKKEKLAEDGGTGV